MKPQSQTRSKRIAQQVRDTKSRVGAPRAGQMDHTYGGTGTRAHAFGILAGRIYGPAYKHHRGMVHFGS